MSSHASLLIRDRHREVWLYRHDQGCPAVCGADVVEIVARVIERVHDLPSASGVAGEFLRLVYPPAADCRAGPVYEVTDGRDFVGDHYRIDLTQRVIGYAARRSWDAGKCNTEDGTPNVLCYTVAEFARFVNAERALANERVAYLKRTQPSDALIQALRPMAMVSI
jgi:hypothetical protein